MRNHMARRDLLETTLHVVKEAEPFQQLTEPGGTRILFDHPARPLSVACAHPQTPSDAVEPAGMELSRDWIAASVTPMTLVVFVRAWSHRRQ